MPPLLGVWLIAVARIEALRQEQQTTDSVAILGEVGRVPELILTVGVIGPDVLNLVAVVASSVDVLRVTRRLA